jgi:Flp pilus assembly protein TadD
MKPFLIFLGILAFWQVTPGYRARQLNSEGAALIQAGHLADAEAKFRQAVQTDPADIDAIVNLGVAIYRQGRFGASIPWFEKGAAARPADPAVHNDLAQAYVRTARPHDAAVEEARACDLDPHNAVYVRYLGDMLLEANDRAGAEKQLRRAAQMDPKSADARLSLARLYVKEDRRGESAANYQASLRLNPRQPDARRELGELYAAGGDYAAAEREFHMAIALESRNALLHQDLGNALLKSGDAAAAEPEFRLAIQLDASLGPAHRDLGLALRDQGNLPGAIEELRRATALMPDDSAVHYMLSQALRRAGHTQDAAAETALAERLSQREKQAPLLVAYGNQAVFLAEHGHAEEALVRIKQALAIDPDDAATQFDYAIVLRHVDRYDDSLSALGKVLARQPDMPGAYYQQGYDYFSEGQLREAVAAFTRAAGLIPGNADVHNGLGVALAASGDTARGRGEIELARRLDPKTKRYQDNLDCLARSLSGCKLYP